MAAICPNCHQAEAVAYVINDEGVHPFPCLGCNASTIRSNPMGVLTGSHPCGTADCPGHVRDEYGYSAQGRLARIIRHRCHFCGSTNTRKVHHGSGHRERALPDPRLQRLQGRRLGDG